MRQEFDLHVCVWISGRHRNTFAWLSHNLCRFCLVPDLFSCSEGMGKISCNTSFFSQFQCLIGRRTKVSQSSLQITLLDGPQPNTVQDYCATLWNLAFLFCVRCEPTTRVPSPTKHREVANVDGVDNFLSLAYLARTKLTKPPEVNQYQHIKQPPNQPQTETCHTAGPVLTGVSALCHKPAREEHP